MRARIYSACRELSWIAPQQAKRVARTVAAARDVVGHVDDGIAVVRLHVLRVWGLLEHARTSLLAHIREDS